MRDLDVYEIFVLFGSAEIFSPMLFQDFRSSDNIKSFNHVIFERDKDRDDL